MKNFFLSILIGIVLVGGISVQTVFADSYGIDKTAAGAGLNSYTNNLPKAAGDVIGTILSLVAVLFFALMIYAGILWMTARGDEDQTKKAFDTIVASVIGIVIILASYAITAFALTLMASK